MAPSVVPVVPPAVAVSTPVVVPSSVVVDAPALSVMPAVPSLVVGVAVAPSVALSAVPVEVPGGVTPVIPAVSIASVWVDEPPSSPQPTARPREVIHTRERGVVRAAAFTARSLPAHSTIAGAPTASMRVDHGG